MNKNNSFLKRTRLLWLCLIGMLATTQFAVASDLWDAGPGTVDASNIKSGYIIVTFPIFDGDGRDEGAAPNSYLSLVDASNNSYTILNIDGNQEDQKDSWTNFWTKAYRHYNNTTCVIAATIYGEKTVGTSSGEQLWFGSTQVNKSPHSMAKFTVYLSQSLLNSGKTFTPKFHLRVDINDGADYDEDHTTSSFNAPIFGSPTISSTTNSTRAGQYDIAFNVSDFSAGQYRFSNEATATTLSSSNKTVTLPLTKNTQDLTLYYWHKLTDACSNTMWIERSVKVTVPAYQKAENFTASNTSAADNTNADTKLTWTISGDASADYGSFEIQRSTDEGFATNVKSFSIGYSSTPYELIDRTSEENINGTVYYRISRLTPSGWKFDPAVTQTAKITKTMSHKGIKAGSVTEEIDAANKVTVKWDFDTGNVISDKSKIVIQRVQLENQKTDLTELDYEATKKSYTEEINAMCKEYHYNVYIKPGNTKYNVQEPVEAKLAAGSPQIVPTNFGNISSLIASKGYFSDRVELEWKLVDGAAETFSIQRREYGSTSDDDYKQLDTKPAFESAQQYTYTDVTSTPGIIYEYRVAGMTSCATGLSTVYSPAAVGFRTPTGDFYGRVTFENGQPEKDVQINVTTEDEIDAHALQIAAGQTATVNNADLLKNATAAATLQAFVSSTSANGDIIAKNGAYILGINNDNYFFTAGDKTLTLNINSLKASAQLGAFVQITGVYTGSELILYINGDSVASLAGAAIVPSNTNIVTFGGNNFAGKIDEVRIWDKALTPADIKRDYNRYLVGNEAGLIAYYTFNYATNIEFYDISYHGTTYNANHGKLNTTALTIATPSIEQLGYKGITREDGSYEVRSVPYKGNGTAYYLVPKLGANHEFESRSEVRFLNAQAQSHTVNFIDKSSFKVTGRVLYAGGTVPVKGVQFQVDGITVMNRGNVVTTDNSGEFEILVPIGVHEVKAVKVNHTFENGGKITDPNGNDLNYQDEKRGVELTDNTTIRFIGRIAGGTQQESYPLGHSLSTNNLGDGVTLTLKYDNDAYRLYGSPSAQPAQDSIFTVAHYRGTHAVNFNIPADSTTVRYTADGRSMIVQPSKTTGEFAVNVIPEDDFTLKLNVPGYTGFEDITIAGGRFANSVIEQFEKHEVEKDSVYSMELGKYKPIAAYTDEAPYYSKLNFSVRTRADMAVAQAKGSDVSSTVPYFGLEKYVISDLVGNKDTITLWNENGYTFAPNAIYEQGKTTLYKISLYEPYPYNDADGKNPSKTDKVPVQKSDIKISNALAKDTTIVTDTAGVAVYKFTAAGIDPGKPEQRIDITMKDNANVKWGFDVICIGAKNEGNDFVTNGPSNVLMVLRDPPGSQSQSFLEAGLKVTKSSTYSGSLSQVGNEELITSAGATTLTMTGAPGAMTGGTIEAENDAGFKLEHEEKYTGEDKEETSYTTTIKYSTSADPGMVGADADIYIGESTNLLFSRTTTVNFVNKSKYDPNLQKQLLESTDDNWKLVQASGLGVAQQFATTFAYSQQHIIDVLIPQLEEARSNVLGKFAYNTYKDYTDAQLQTLANDLKELVIVSKLPTDAPDYGQSNTTDLTDRYRWFYPATYTATTGRIGTDTIQAINQSIKRWEDAIAKNEQAKVYAIENREKCLLKNYSFQGGADIEYSEAYSTTNEHTSSFEVTIDIKAFGWIETKVFGSGVTLKLEEGGATVQSGNTSSSAGREHTKGFTLSDNASDNYLSVDVFNEPKWNAKSNSYEAWTREDEKYEDGNLSEGMVDEKDITAKSHFSTFIFSTRGGATSCPYEDEAVTKYFEPGKVISEKTIQIEQPGIIIAPTTLINVPSGKSGNFKLTMYNNATYKTDIETELLIDNASNTRGLKFYIDGAPIGNGRYFVIPAGSTVEKTLEVLRGVDMQYDDVKLILKSVCDNIADTINFNIHFTPSCTDINLRKPTTAWVYNTKLDTLGVNGVPEHYLNVTIDGFDQNYDNFHHIELQRKTASQSDAEWKPLASFYANDSIFAVDSTAVGGAGVDKIKESDRGSIFYKLFMDGQSDQRYDIRAVSVCMVNGQPLAVDKVQAESEIHSGIKDMYNPRLFGAAQPADGILDVEDEIRLNFNEPIAAGLLTKDNFQVRGIRNGTVNNHSTSVRFDGINDYADTEFSKNLTGKDITVEMWIQPANLQNATLFSQGNINNSLELSLTADNKLALKIGETTATSSVLDYSPANPNYADGSWAHVALVYNAADNTVSAYYNLNEVISQITVPEAYSGIGNIVIGKSIATDGGNYAGKIHNVRVWEKAVNSRNLQLNSNLQLAGIEEGLMAYYPMTEGRGETFEDKARGATLTSHGTEWALPEGFAAKLSGADYLKVDASTAGFTKEMDYTVELWFKAEAGQTNATIIGAGSGETGSAKPDYGFSIGFDADGKLAYTNNEVKTIVEGEYRDNNWHHFAFSVDRAKGKGQIYIDGNLTNYIDAATIGGITNDYIYVGARGWYDKNNVVNLIVDNYFKGEVDDIRFWELYKNEKMVRDNNNVKLTGTELGLVHYYPFDYYFEYQGLQYVDFTDLDKRISHTANPETDKFEVVGGTIDNVKSSDIAPLKDFGPIDDLDFDFVVNNDALIITLKEQEYKIAKTIITFTVYDVRDLNGNSILSPITWSAYIDRNQLRWETDRLDISKAEYEPYEFTVKAVNNGGAVRNYTITNAPSWLTVTPSRGTLQPKAYDIITFTIDEGLNTGTYNEVVYLVNDEGVAEPLQLNITVQGEKPEWVVDASKYKYDMVVFGKVRFDNIFSADKNDMLAAFDKRTKECIGVTNSYYDKKFDMWYALLTIYSNAQTINAADLEFRTWDASTGKVYKATADRIIAFKADGIIGDVDDPVIFDGKEVFYQNIPLSNGWNWVSFNLKPENSDLKSVLEQGKWTGDDQIKNRNEFYAYSATSGNWTSSTGQAIALNNTSMYKLHSTGEQLLQISGSAVDTKTTPIEIIGGGYWNYIGYLPQVNTTVKEALAGYDAQKGDIVKSQTTFAMYSRNEWVGTLGYMEANKGYMLYRGAEGNTSFIYPKGSASLSRRAKSAFAEDANLGYADNMTLVATADILQPNDIITAYINGEVRGEGKYIAGNDDQTLNFITVQGAEQGANIRFDLQRNAQVIGSSYNQLQYANNAAAGTIDEPFVLDFGIKEQNVTLYPNPFVNDLLVEVFASEGAVITLSVQDILGRTVLNGISQTATGEFTQITLNGASLATGIYLLKVSVDGEVSTYKIEKN